MSARAPTAGGRGRLAEGVRNVLLLAFSLGFALLLGEGVLRAAGYRAIYEVYSKPSAFWVHDAELGWSHPPGAHGEFVGPRPWPIEFEAPISINHLGLRGPDPRASEAAYRVLVLGDSMVASFEVPYDQTFTALLETDLSARLGAEVQVINAGVRGYGTDQSYLYYAGRGRALEPDVVVLFHSGNDLSDNVKLHEMRRPLGKPAFALQEDGSLRLLGSPVPEFQACSEYRVSRAGEVVRIDTAFERAFCAAQMGLFDHSALFSFVTLLVPWKPEWLQQLYRVGLPDRHESADGNGAVDPETRYRIDLTLALIEALDREVEADGGRFLVIGVGRQLATLGLSDLAARGIAAVELAHLDAVSDESIRWRHDAHYNPSGHARLAQQLGSSVEPLLRARTASARDASVPAN
jgi:hypothetical protein